MRKQFRELTPLDDALAVLDGLRLEPTTETVDLVDARGRVLAERVTAPMDVPGFDRSIMDGYAVVAADTVGAYDDDPVELRYAGAVVPGEAPTVAVGAGEAVEIATGAVIPDGADAVVRVEDTAREGDTVAVRRPVTPQEAVMGRGADIAAGETVLRAGERLDARRIGLLAAIGTDAVPVARRPTVGIISTGSEIVRPAERDRLAAGEIFDINSFSMAAAIEDAGAVAEVYPHVPDAYDAIRGTFETAAAACDLVVSSGSTSASAEDVVYRIVEDAGELLLHGIAAKPGKPTVFGRIDGTPVLGMPGNPISALMNFRLFVRPLLGWALGERGAGAGTVEATAAVDVDSVGGRTQLSPVGLVEDPARGLLAYPVDKGSGAITSLADADGYLTIPDDVKYVAAGAVETVTLLDDTVGYPAVLLAGEPCPVLDRLLDTVDTSVRWLDAGSVDGVRKLRDGIADVAGVSLPDDDEAAAVLEGVERVRGYDRRIGLAHPGADGDDVEAVLADGTTVASLPRQTGMYRHLDALLERREVEVTRLVRPSEAGLVAAVAAGDADAALVLEESTANGAVAFTPVGWTPLDFLVATDRREKAGVDRLLERIADVAVDEVRGFRVPDDIGDRLPAR